MSNYQGLLNAVGIGASHQSTAIQVQKERDAYNAAMQNTALQNAMVGNQHTQVASAYGAQGTPYTPHRVYEIPNNSIIKDPNKIASMVMPLSALVDIWRVKFGDTWLPSGEPPPATEDYELWKMAAVRLHANSKFEVVAGYFRLKENA